MKATVVSKTTDFNNVFFWGLAGVGGGGGGVRRYCAGRVGEHWLGGHVQLGGRHRSGEDCLGCCGWCGRRRTDGEDGGHRVWSTFYFLLPVSCLAWTRRNTAVQYNCLYYTSTRRGELQVLMQFARLHATDFVLLSLVTSLTAENFAGYLCEKYLAENDGR